MATIHFRTLGCRLNRAEAERLALGFKLAGHDVVETAEQADVLVVNTCSVTSSAGAKSRRAAQPAKTGQRVVVTGCHSQVSIQDFESADLVVPNELKHELVSLTLERFGMDGFALGMDYSDHDTPAIYPLILGHTRAFVKIQDGCNLRCTFCMTTIARGASQSRDANEVVDEVRGLASRGCKEAVLTGVHAGSYVDGHDIDLGRLIERIMCETKIERLRLSSLEPWNFKTHWVRLWEQFGDRLCPHLHMSLQSGSATVLQRMARPYNPPSYADKLALLRDHIPRLAVTTDIIVGFPGETDAEHAESLDFVEKMQFSGAHIFTFSSRPGTEAAVLSDQVGSPTKQARYREMKRCTSHSATTCRLAMLGEHFPVLWEAHNDDGTLSGLTDTYMRVHTRSDAARPNTITRTRMDRESHDRLWGSPLPICV